MTKTSKSNTTPAIKKIVSLDKQNQRLKVESFELDNPIVFNFFDNKVRQEDYDATLLRALNIGVLAMLEDRFSAFLAKTKNELGVELESLKLLMDMKSDFFMKSAVKGMGGEDDVFNALSGFTQQRGWCDTLEKTGAKTDPNSPLSNNKTGDIVCDLGVAGQKIVVEVKFDKNYTLGEIESKDIFAKKADSALGQLLEATANRSARMAIIVFDKALLNPALAKEIDSLAFFPGYGFVTIVDTMGGDFNNLYIAYSLARDLINRSQSLKYEHDILAALVKRIIKDAQSVLSIRKHIKTMRDSLDSIETDLSKVFVSLELSSAYLEKFLKEGELSRVDFFPFYSGLEAKKKFEGKAAHEWLEVLAAAQENAGQE